MQGILRRFLIPAALLAALTLSRGAGRAQGDKPAEPPGEAAGSAEAQVQITVLTPQDAEVFFDGEPTVLKGAERRFICPPLPIGKTYHYEVLARWKDGDKKVEQTRRVAVTGGAAVRVDFLAMPPANKDEGNAVGRSVGPAGRLFHRGGGAANAWGAPMGEKATIASEDLLISLPGGEIETSDGAVHLELLKLFNSPLPVMEPAVTLHQAKDADLAFTLERGMVEFWNTKAKGSARVQIHARGETWEVALDEPGARMLVELYSAWPKGARFKKTPGPGDAPLARMTFLVLKGQADLKHAGTQMAMSAPPGPAVIEWDSVTGMDDSPQQLKELPAWVQPPTDEAGKAFAAKAAKAVGAFADEAAKSKSLAAAADKFLASDDPLERKLAVVALAASDELPRLGKALRESHRADVWEDAVLALRHWIGRGPGQDQKLYQGMIDAKTFTPAEADAALQLLHDFSNDDLANPATYAYLINRLGNDQLFVRGLAYWHLSRLAPEGKKFGYDPRAPKEQRDAAMAKWKELIPEGKLPPTLKADGK